MPLAAAQIWNIADERQRQLLVAEQKALSVAQYGATMQQTVFDEARLFVRLMRSILEEESDADCPRVLREFAGYAVWLKRIIRTDEKGTVNCASQDAVGPLSIADRPYFQEVLATQNFTISNLIVGQVGGEPTVSAALPLIKPTGELTGVLLASLDLGVVSERLGRIAEQSGVRLFLSDGDGTVVSTYPSDGYWVGRSLDDLQLRTDGSTDFLEGTDPKGGDLLIVFADIPETVFRIAGAVRRDVVLQAIDRAIMRSLAEFTIATILFVLAVWIAGERLLIRPMSALALVARRLGAGDLTARATSKGWPPELAEPAQAFNSMAEQLASREADLKEANQRLFSLASHDKLTGLANRRHFDELLEEEWKRALRERQPLAIASIDVDFFKRYNDMYGHLAGDDCLLQVAQALEHGGRRPGDLAARIGGEEFAILLPATSAASAFAVAERVQQRLSDMDVEHLDSDFGRVTLSIGIAAMVPDPDLPVKSLLSAADEALYVAKRSGRNRIVQFRTPATRLVTDDRGHRRAKLRDN